LQEAAFLFGISPSTMTKWVATGVIHVEYPFHRQRPLVSSGEVSRVMSLLAA
jgi:hypothetical protein